MDAPEGIKEELGVGLSEVLEVFSPHRSLAAASTTASDDSPAGEVWREDKQRSSLQLVGQDKEIRRGPKPSRIHEQAAQLSVVRGLDCGQ